MKSKAFTLIELLVVVAIIGILAAVGVSTFSGFQEKAKVAAVKANQKTVLKWITTEAYKCQLGFDDIFNGKANCNEINSTLTGGGNPSPYTVRKIEEGLKGKFKNPYGVSDAGFGKDEGVTAYRIKSGARSLGYVLLNVDHKAPYYFRISVSVCYKLPCSGDRWDNPGPNIIVDIYTWYP